VLLCNMNFFCNPLYIDVELPEDGLNEAEISFFFFKCAVVGGTSE